MLKQKNHTGSVQEVILPDFPDDDDNTVTTTVTKSRRVSFGPNFVKEFIVDSAISAQCMAEYEQPFPSSDSSNADSTHSAISHGTFVLQENVKVHKPDSDAADNRPKPPKFASTICFSADSPTADMEFTEGCITLAKTILDKKNKEMTVFIQAKPKGPKEEEKTKEDETNYFEGSQFEMSMTQCLKSKEKRREEKRLEKTKIFGKYDDEMSMTRCERFYEEEDEESKENRMPLDAIMRYLDKDESDSDLFNPEKSFTQLLGVNNSLEVSEESEQLNLNESMEISGDLNIPVGRKSTQMPPGCPSENEPSGGSSYDDEMDGAERIKLKGGCLDVSEQAIRCSSEASSEEMAMEETTDEEFVSEKVRTEEIVSGRLIAEEIGSEEKSSEKMVVEEMIVEDLVLQKVVVTEEMIAIEERAAKKIRTEEMSVETPEKIIDEDMIGERITEEILAEKTPSAEKALTQETAPKTRTEEMLAENMATPDKTPEKTLLSEKILTEERGVKKTRTEEIMDEKTAPEKMVTEEMVPEKISEEIEPEEMPFQEIIPDETAAKNTRTEEIVDKERACEEMIEKNVRPEEMIAEKMATQEKTSEDIPSETFIFEATEDMKARTEKTVSKEMLDGKTAPEKTITEEMVPEKTFQEIGAEKMPSEKIIPEETAAKTTSEVLAEEITTEKMAPKEMVRRSLLPAEETSVEDTITEDLMDVETSWHPPPFAPKPTPAASQHFIPQEDDDSPTEPSLGDLKVIETLKEQAKEKGCVWSLRDVRHPRKTSQGLISFSCSLLDSTTSLQFSLKTSEEDALDSCSLVTDSAFFLDEERGSRLSEYTLAVGFGFDELKKYLGSLQGVATLRHVPYYLDRVNSFLSKMNGYLRQIHGILSSYPGSRLNGCLLSFRLFSFPMLCSCVVSIELSNLFRLSRGSLSFSHDFGCLDERKVGEIFDESLKGENSLCEFVVRSTRYLVEEERQSGYLSKRKHIRLLPDELKS